MNGKTTAVLAVVAVILGVAGFALARFLPSGAAVQAASSRPSWERHGNVVVGMAYGDFAGGQLVREAVVDGDQLFHVAKRDGGLSVWVPQVALPQIEKDLREVYQAQRWAIVSLGNAPKILEAAPPPPEKLDRVFRMSHAERVARLERIEKRPPSNLAVIIQDQEIDIGRWRTELNLMKDMSPAKRLELAEHILESMESRLRIWLDRYVDKL